MKTNTKEYPESKGGILICGYNSGGSPNEEVVAVQEQSYFSDKLDDGFKWRYNRRWRKWFDDADNSLRTENPGRFEHSITSMNWFLTQSINLNGIKLLEGCIEEPDYFLDAIEYFRPSLILFSGIAMFEAINHFPVLTRLERIVGELISPPEYRKERYRIGFCNFQETRIIALPHMRTPLPMSFVEKFSPEIGKAIREFRALKGY